MFNLENEMREWLRTLRRSQHLEASDITELESHLRDEIDFQIENGHSEEAAFRAALAKSAPPDILRQEYKYAKLYERSRPFWHPSRIIPSLIWNSIKIALRKMRRQKGYSFINIAGLALGMAACILILLWVQDELNFDRFHKQVDSIYRVNVQIGERLYASAPSLLAVYLKDELPEVLETVRVMIPGDRFMKFDKGVINESGFTYADPSFFKMFTFPLLSGDPETALEEPYSIVISEKISRKYFGEYNPMGSILSLDSSYSNQDIKVDYRITGVMKDMPRNSHLQLDFIASEKTFGSDSDNWRALSYHTYVLLKKGTDIHEFNAKVRNFIQSHDASSQFKLSSQPLTSIYFDSNIRGYEGPSGEKKYVYIFSLIAFFILIIACINFTNLSTARSSTRSKEIGIRKVVGARRQTLIKQFMAESLAMSFISLALALILVELLLPAFNHLSSKDLSINFFGNSLSWIGFFSIAFLAGILSGIYPALFLSSFQPVETVTGRLFSGKAKSHFREILVVAQFSLSIFLIIVTIVIGKQVNFMHSKDLGYDKDQIVTVEGQYLIDVPFESIKKELQKNPNILGVTAAFQPPIDIRSSASSSNFGWQGRDRQSQTQMTYLDVEFDFIDVFNIKILQGRNFSKEISTDKGSAFIVNEEAARIMGKDFSIGKDFYLHRNKGKVIGLVQNFHFRPFHFKIEPLVLRIADIEGLYHHIFIKIDSTNIQGAIQHIRNTFDRFNPGYSFDYSFLDDAFNNLYQAEGRINTLFNYFTALAIFISCLGLFGLTAFLTERRTKEIGIRKILGASVPNIVGLFSGKFVVLVMLANIIAWPFSFYIMGQWLNKFAYKISMNIWIFLLSGLAALLIALITVSTQALRAAASCPINSLRNE